MVPYTKGFRPKFTMVFRNLFVIMSIKLEIAKKAEMFFNKIRLRQMVYWQDIFS